MTTTPIRALGRAPVPPGVAPVPVPGPTSPRGGRGWYVLLAVPVVAALLTPLYNRIEPTLFGLPFFYWSQLGLALLEIFMITIVYQATKRWA
jgi:hypothetical protein